VEIDHPTDDPTLPSYHHPTLRAVEPQLRKAYHVWTGLTGEDGNGKPIKEAYLPKEPREPLDAYEARLKRSVFCHFLPEAIVGLAGVLNSFTLASPPKSMEARLQNIDGKGNSLKTWLLDANSLMLRDGALCIQVEMPPNEARSNKDVLDNGIAPYLVKRERSKVINWRFHEDGKLDWVIFLEAAQEPDGSKYGVKIVYQYRVVGRGYQQVLQLKRDKSGKFTVVEQPKIEILNSKREPADRVPVVWYPSKEADFGEGELPLQQAIDLSVAYFQKLSDLWEKDHACNVIIPVIAGQLPPAPGQEHNELVIGNNSAIFLENGGTFNLATADPGSMAESRAQIQDIERMIATQALNFRYGDPDNTKTATQAGMEGAQTESKLRDSADRMASMMQEVMAIWCMFTGETLQPDAGLSMAPSVFERPLDAQGIAQLQRLTGDGQLLSSLTAITELSRRGIYPALDKPEDEVTRINEEQAAASDVGVSDELLLQ
jgi:hypothetical protein